MLKDTVPLLPRQQGRPGQYRSGGHRQVHRQGRNPRGNGRRQGHRRGHRRGGGAQRGDGGVPALCKRQAVLNHCVARFRERFEETRAWPCASRPASRSSDARGEVTRLIDTFRVAAEESVRIGGEVLNLEISPRARGYRGMWKRVPIGPCSLHLAVQLPAQPRRAQDRAGDRSGLPVRDEARVAHADRRADHRRGAGRNRPAARRVLDPARAAATAPTCSPRTSASSCSASPARRRSAGI
jgi:hypothetical protein